MTGWRRSSRDDVLTSPERALLERAELPPDIRDLLAEVVAGGGLSGEDRPDVLRELISHFEEGLAAGRPSGELLRAFGTREALSLRLGRARRGRLGGANWRRRIEGAARDVRLAVRALVRNPGYAAVAVITLCLGIGANTAVFSVVNGVLLKPLPYPDPDRLVMLLRQDARGGMRLPWSVPNLREFDRTTASFDAIVGYRWRDVTLTGAGDPRFMNAVAVSGGLLDVFGLRPAAGRDIRREETVPGGPAVVLVSHAFWRDQLGADPAAVGRTLRLSGESYEIIGVAPPEFAHPGGAEIWMPGRWSEETFPRGRLTLNVVGRLARGVSPEAAREELSAVAERLETAFPDDNAGMNADLMSLMEYSVGRSRVGLLVLLGAVAMVLLIACVNVANVVLVRGANRSVEMAVRSALGAARGALVRQLLAESLVLSVAGGTLGLLLAVWGVRGLHVLAEGYVPRMSEVSVDGTVLCFAAVLAILVALLFGLWPALRVSHASRAGVVRAGRQESGTGPLDGRLARFGLLAAEVALSVTLLVGAGLLLRSFARIRAVDLGFEPRDVVQFTVTLPDVRYDGERAVAFFDALRERLQAIPGVEAAAVASGSPFGPSHTSLGVDIVGNPPPPAGEEPLWLVRWVSPGYIEMMDIPLLQGRDLGPADRAGAPPVALISRGTADRYYADEDPVGKRFRFDEDGPDWTVVGVVGDVRSYEVTQAAEPEVYVPYPQWHRTAMTGLLRTSQEVPGLVDAIHRTVAELDTELAIQNLHRLERAVADSASPERFYLLLLALFAGLAVVLAAVGVYGVVAYVVSGRTREIGIRMALGAHRSAVVRMVAAQGIRPVTVGTIVGLAGALAAGRLLASLLYEVDPRDPLTLAGSTVLLFLAAAAACVIPAWRASRISPTDAIRAE